MRERELQSWSVFYWMPYDNDLAQCEAPILDMLQQGSRRSSAVVAAQVDRPGAHAMERVVLHRGERRSTEVGGYDGSSARAFQSFLEWADRDLCAANWVVIALGHGGGLDRFAPDWAGKGSWSADSRWMSVEDAGRAVARLNRRGRVALTFLQNCCKGTIEATFAFRRCAEYVLASQTLLGAPNRYYAGMLEHLGEVMEPSGESIARAIARSEGPGHVQLVYPRGVRRAT